MTSQPSIFVKSNLVHIPLSITIAHILKFIVNSPLSTWQKFPPQLPVSVYSSIYFTPLLLFISLTFEPIQTRKRFFTLLSLALIFLSIPIIYRGEIYPPILQNTFVMISLFYGSKMLLFLKLDQKKEFKSFLWTLFNWRFNSYIISPKEVSIIKSPPVSQINKKLINRVINFIVKWLIYEVTIFNSTKYAIEIPEKAYQIRLVEFFTKGIPATTIPSLLQCLNYTVTIYLWLSLYYDMATIILIIIFRFLCHSTLEKTNYKPILIRSGLLSPSEYTSLNKWFITFLFNTKHMFSEFWLASNPRDFWSVRWQLILNKGFKELGYFPVRNLFASFVPRRIANVMGVLGAFGVSALIHEYLIIGDFNIWTGEHFFFFTTHGVILILWEAVFDYENKNEDTKINRFLKWILVTVIYLSILPAFIEPIRRRLELFYTPSYFAQYYVN